ncbi:hypothetical protein ACF0H5_013458 [Mactra antiquata]
MFAPKSVLVTGSTQGIGLEFVKQFLKLPQPPKHIFASCIDPKAAKELNDISKENFSVKVLQLDVTDQQSCDNAKSFVESIVKDEGLTLLVNNAGINRRCGFQDVTREDMRSHFEVNAMGPLFVTQTFYPLLKQSSSLQPDLPMSCNKAAVVMLGSGQASFTENASGGMYPYRAAKVALNMMTLNMSYDLKQDGILCASIAPGWVKTDMGGPNALVTTEESVQSYFTMLGTLGEEHTGKFYHCVRNAPIPW